MSMFEPSHAVEVILERALHPEWRIPTKNELREAIDKVHEKELAELRARLAEAEKERDVFGSALSSLSSWLSGGSGDERTTAADYEERIRWGCDHIVKVETDRRERTESERDELRRSLGDAVAMLKEYVATWNNGLNTMIWKDLTSKAAALVARHTAGEGG